MHTKRAALRQWSPCRRYIRRPTVARPRDTSLAFVPQALGAEGRR